MLNSSRRFSRLKNFRLVLWLTPVCVDADPKVVRELSNPPPTIQSAPGRIITATRLCATDRHTRTPMPSELRSSRHAKEDRPQAELRRLPPNRSTKPTTCVGSCPATGVSRLAPSSARFPQSSHAGWHDEIAAVGATRPSHQLRLRPASDFSFAAPAATWDAAERLPVVAKSSGDEIGADGALA